MRQTSVALNSFFSESALEHLRRIGLDIDAPNQRVAGCAEPDKASVPCDARSEFAVVFGLEAVLFGISGREPLSDRLPRAHELVVLRAEYSRQAFHTAALPHGGTMLVPRRRVWRTRAARMADSGGSSCSPGGCLWFRFEQGRELHLMV